MPNTTLPSTVPPLANPPQGRKHPVHMSSTLAITTTLPPCTPAPLQIHKKPTSILSPFVSTHPARNRATISIRKSPSLKQTAQLGNPRKTTQQPLSILKPTNYPPAPSLTEPSTQEVPSIKRVHPTLTPSTDIASTTSATAPMNPKVSPLASGVHTPPSTVPSKTHGTPKFSNNPKLNQHRHQLLKQYNADYFGTEEGTFADLPSGKFLSLFPLTLLPIGNLVLTLIPLILRIHTDMETDYPHC